MSDVFLRYVHRIWYDTLRMTIVSKSFVWFICKHSPSILAADSWHSFDRMKLSHDRMKLSHVVDSRNLPVNVLSLNDDNKHLVQKQKQLFKDTLWRHWTLVFDNTCIIRVPCCLFQWRIQDFPDGGGGANFQVWGENYYFANSFPKTAWKWKNLDPEGARVPGAPLRSATVFTETTHVVRGKVTFSVVCVYPQKGEGYHMMYWGRQEGGLSFFSWEGLGRKEANHSHPTV